MIKLRYTRSSRRFISLALTLGMLFCSLVPSVSYAYTERAATINASSLNIRSGPGTSYNAVTKLGQGAGVTVIGESKGSDGNLWYQIRFNQNGTDQTGYTLGSYIKFPVAYTSDGSFESYLSSQGFPESYKNSLRQLHAEYPKWVFKAQQTNLDWNTVIQNESVVGRNLVGSSSISSWKSTADGAYNWDSSSWPGFDSSSWVAASTDIIRYYMDPRNFLDETYIFQFLLHSYDSSAHTKDGLQSLVSGSFLAGNSPSVTGGSDNSSSGGTDSSGDSGSPDVTTGVGPGPGASNSGSTGNSSSGGSSSGSGGSAGSGGSGVGSNVIGNQAPGGSSGSDVKLEGPTASITRKNMNMVADPSSYGPGMTGSSGSAPGNTDTGSQPSSTATGEPYVDIIMRAGAATGVNPYVIAAMIIQEQGTNGTSGSISGNAYGYTGYYNFFNIEAYQSGSMTPVQRGLWYASQSGSYGRPWNTPEKAITGGSQFYGNTYVKAGQDTFYLKKYNVQGSNMYKHQYMTNVQGAAGEGAKLSKAYSAALKQTALEFKIPVYTNMPDTPCAKPTVDGSPNNKLSNLSVDGFNVTPTFSKDTASYDLIVDPSVSSVYIQASPISSKATVSGAGSIQLASGNNDLKISVKAENGSVREYILRVVRQNNGQTGSGGGSSSGASSGSGQGPGGGSGPGGSGSDGSQSQTTPGGSNVIIVP